MKLLKHFLIAIFIWGLSLFPIQVKAQVCRCTANLKNDTLVIQNSKIERKWLWNGGDIIAYSMKDIQAGKTIFLNSSGPSFVSGDNKFERNIDFKITRLNQDIFNPAHLEVEIVNQYQDMVLKRVFKIFEETPAISCDYYLKYSVLFQKSSNQQKVDGTEGFINEKSTSGKLHQDIYFIQDKHWKVKVVSFKDATDVNDNLVSEREIMPYNRGENMIGNLLFANDLVNSNSFFILKEAPNAGSQINYPSYDYSVTNQEISVAFSGFPLQSSSDDWIKGYTITTGTGKSEQDCTMALRTYLKNSINYNSKAYDMVMMNTWGDRAKDGKISERFILKELEAAQKLGITHFQIDDGWQQGLSANSSVASGGLWGNFTAENWKPNKERFPNGLDSIVQSAKEKNIRLGLWFNPRYTDSYKNWESDAKTIVDLYKRYNIQYFKIDGVQIDDKLAEENLVRLFSNVKLETNGAVFFNLDLTAGVRGGYFSYRWAGNLFLENRYTDWANYYPFHTLRNVWMLSKYFPPEMLQLEFLNKWRNANKYHANDPFKPSLLPFDYIFATTMVGQPLAWFEATGLPREAFDFAPLIDTYKTHMAAIHQGMVFPIGEEPSGKSWTGFQSINGDKGYLIVYRENNKSERALLKTLFEAGQRIKCNSVAGNGKDFTSVVNERNEIEFLLSNKNSFAMYEYDIL